MKILLTVFLISSLLFAKSDKLSHIPPTKSAFIDIDPTVCDIVCLEKLLEDGKIFSFLSKQYKVDTELASIQSELEYYQRIFRIYDDAQTSVRIAVLIPQRSIRRYAISTVNSIMAYMLTKQNDFEVRVFNSLNEDRESIKNTLREIEDKRFTHLIAPVTSKGAKFIKELATSSLNIYIPTVHKPLDEETKHNIVYGGVNYKSQIDELSKLSNDKLSYFWDGSSISETLNTYIEQKNTPVVYKKKITNSRIDFKRMLKNNKSLQGSSVFFNTPLVKTSLVASQLRVYEIQPHILLSTQINYNPLILTLTQYDDRKNLYLANSIGKSTVSLQETNELFDHNIVYDWVNYSTSIGIDYFFTHYFVPTEPKLFSEEIVDNQVKYDISLVKPQRYKFINVAF